MIKLKLFNLILGAVKPNRYLSRLQRTYKNRAAHFVSLHNLAYPNDPWIFHGTYSRIVDVWDHQKKRWVTLSVKIIRIRSKASHRTFAFQGGFFFQNRRHFGLTFLMIYLSFRSREKDKSYRCYHFDAALESAFATFKRNITLFVQFLRRKKALGLLDQTAYACVSMKTFIEDYWFVPGNPFCSAMEAGMLL